MACGRLPMLHLRGQAVVESNQSELYLLDISAQEASCTAETKVAVAGSDAVVRIFNQQSLQLSATLKGHEDQVTGVQFAHRNSSLCFTSSLDGTVRCWDLRSPSDHAVRIFYGFDDTPPSFGAFALNFNDRCLAAGTESANEEDACLVIWDARQENPLGTYSESFAASISKVRFHPSRSSLVLTASEDGLIDLFDLHASCEDDALLATFNVESSANALGWCGTDASRLFCCSDFLHLHRWTAEEPFNDLPVWQASGSEDHPVHYLLDCLSLPTMDHDCVLAGSKNGDLRIQEATDGAKTALLTGGHSSTVRASAWDSMAGVLFTGCEEGRLCLWAAQGEDAEAEKVKGEKVKGKPVKPKEGSKNQHKAASNVAAHRKSRAKPY